MWPLFFLPWVTTVVHPILGFLSTTAVMLYHYTYKREIIQRIELSILPTPAVNIFEHHMSKKEKHAPQTTNDRQAAGGFKKELGEGPPKMESHGPQGEGQSDAEQKETEAQIRKKSPYIWTYSSWQ